MPTITVDLDDLRGLIGSAELSDAEIEGHLALVKGEFAGREAEAKPTEVRIELQDTNRPDLWCPEGIARQIGAKLRGELRLDYAPAFAADPDKDACIEADADLEQLRPFVAGFVVRDVTIDEPGLVGFIQTQEKLAENFGRKRAAVSIGIYDASQIQFPVRYAAVPRQGPPKFAPLGFEEEMTPAEILERHPKGIEYRGCLDRDGEDAPRVPMLMDANDCVLSFPPIINSRALGEVKPGMDHLFVEATGDDQLSVMLALNILAANMVDRGGKVSRVVTRYPYDTPMGREVASPSALPRAQKARCSVSEVCSLLGTQTDGDDIAARLRAYGVASEAAGDGALEATLPPWRADYLHAVDVVEDYAISVGFDSFEPILPEDWSPGRLSTETNLEDLLRDRLIGFGFEEIISNVLTNRTMLRVNQCLGDADAPANAEDEGRIPKPGFPPPTGSPLVRIRNPMSDTYSVLRDWLLPFLLRVEATSPKALYPHRVFEAGEVAVPDPDANLGSRTERRLSALLAHEKASLSELQSHLDLLLYYLDIDARLEAGEDDHPTFIPGRLGLVWTGEGSDRRCLGWIGEVHPEVLERWGIRAPVAAFELRQAALVG